MPITLQLVLLKTSLPATNEINHWAIRIEKAKPFTASRKSHASLVHPYVPVPAISAIMSQHLRSLLIHRKLDRRISPWARLRRALPQKVDRWHPVKLKWVQLD